MTAKLRCRHDLINVCFYIVFCSKMNEISFLFFFYLQRHALQADSLLVLNGATYENRGVPSIMSFCLTKIVSLVSELFKSESKSKSERGQRQRQRQHFMVSLTVLTAEGKYLMKSRNTLYPVRLRTEDFLRNWTFLIHIISLIYHKRAGEMTGSGPPNLPRRTNNPQGRWRCSCIEMSAKMAACFLLRPFNYGSYSGAQMKTYSIL